MQGEQDRKSDSGEWGDLAESFFERGETLGTVEDPASESFASEDEPTKQPLTRVLAVVQAWVMARVAQAHPWLLLRMKLLQLRATIAVGDFAEHAVVSVHELLPYVRRPRLAVRNPRIVHASRVLLFSAAVNYGVICVLASFGI
jgi:hypothetical protein